MKSRSSKPIVEKLRQRVSDIQKTLGIVFVSIVIIPMGFATPVVAQTITELDVCQNAVITAINNGLTLIGIIGPAIALIAFLLSLIVLSYSKNPDTQRLWKDRLKHSVLYGGAMVIGTQIFLLFLDVAGGSMTSCIAL